MNTELLLKAYRLMIASQYMADTYEQNRQVCKYVHSTSLGHQAIQLAAAFHLQPQDFVSPYYRDESMLLGMGYTPGQLMRQLLARADDPFSGGRSYYSHPSNISADKPRMIHQSSATGMQAIPSTGIAQGLQYLDSIQSSLIHKGSDGELPIVLCSFGDASVTEGEVGEAFQFAVLKKLPILYLVQDNGWGISAKSDEARAMNAVEFAKGFPGLHTVAIDGTNFEYCHLIMGNVIKSVRSGQGPYLVQASVPLLGHHTSGVRREFYRSEKDLAEHRKRDPIPILRRRLAELGVAEAELIQLESEAKAWIASEFADAVAAAEPDQAVVAQHVFAPTPVMEEKGTRNPGGKSIPMVDAALFAIREIMEDFPEAVLYGQDVGRLLGGVFREAATLADTYGDHRVFNMAIQEAYIIGSTAGMSAAGVKPIVEVQFGDYIWPGLNQLVSEISKSNYLTMGKYPVQMVLRVPVGAYGGGGPYHSGSVESTLLSIKGIKVVYPSNTADMKGLMKAAFLDPNPVLMLEHKGLYWSKVPGTEDAKCPEPSKDYIVPLGKGRVVLEASSTNLKNGDSCCVVTYGMGVYWAKAAAARFAGQIEIIDLRSLYPLDEALVFEAVKKHGKCLVLTEEPQTNSFAEALAGRISQACFQWLDAPVMVLGALDLPAVPINLGLERAMLPSADKLTEKLEQLLNF